MAKNTTPKMVQLDTAELCEALRTGTYGAVKEANRRLAKGVRAKNARKIRAALDARHSESTPEPTRRDLAPVAEWRLEIVHNVPASALEDVTPRYEPVS